MKINYDLQEIPLN